MKAEINLSEEQFHRILCSIAALGDNYFLFVNKLVEAGFTSFLSYQEYSKSFVEPEESALHSKVVVEQAKWRLAGKSWNGRRWVDGYQSDLLLTAAKEREDWVNQYSFRYGKRPPYWETRPFEFERRQEQLEQYPRSGQILKITEQRNYSFKMRRENEISKFSPLVNDETLALTSQSVKDHWIQLCADEAPKIGYSLDVHASNAAFKVFTHRINDSWSLAFCLENPKELDRVAASGNQLSLRFHLRRDGVKGRLAPIKAGQFINFDLTNFIEGFKASYTAYSSIPEMDVCARSQLALLALTSEQLVEGITKPLQGK
jgi:hypothetical protein